MSSQAQVNRFQRFATEVAAEDDGRIHMVCIRPLGPFAAFDERLNAVALRHVRSVRVSIFRTWDFAARHDLGFVSPTLPTVIIVRDGEAVAKAIGDVPQRELEDMLSRATPAAEARRAA